MWRCTPQAHPGPPSLIMSEASRWCGPDRCCCRRRAPPAERSNSFDRFGASRVIFGAAAPLGLLAPALRRAGAQRIVGLTHGHEAWWSAVPGARRLLRRIGDGCDHLTDHLRLYRTADRPCAERIGPRSDAAAAAAGRRGPVPAGCSSIMIGLAVSPLADSLPQKGFSCLLRAWRLILDGRRAADPPLELILIGDGPQRTRLESMIDRLGLARHRHPDRRHSPGRGDQRTAAGNGVRPSGAHQACRPESRRVWASPPLRRRPVDCR